MARKKELYAGYRLGNEIEAKVPIGVCHEGSTEREQSRFLLRTMISKCADPSYFFIRKEVFVSAETMHHGDGGRLLPAVLASQPQQTLTRHADRNYVLPA